MSRWVFTIIFVSLCFLATEIVLGEELTSDPNLKEKELMSHFEIKGLNFESELQRQEKIFEKLIAELKNSSEEKKFRVQVD